MKLTIAGTVLVAVVAASLPASASDEKSVTITGCLLKGNKGGYVMTNVSEISGAGMPHRVIYWLSGAKGLSDHVGHKIAVSGTIKPTDGGEVEVEPASIEVEARGREIEAMTTDTAKVPEGGARKSGKIEKEIKMPAYKVKVKKIEHLSPTCP